MFYMSIFAPLGELKSSMLKTHQSRQPGQEQTATWKSLWTGPRKSKRLQRMAHPSAQVLCHRLKPSSIRESPTKAATWESSGSEIPLKLKTLGLVLTSGQFVFVPEVAGKCGGRFWDGGFRQRDAKAGFSLGFIIDLEMAGCSALVFMQTSPCRDLLRLLCASSYLLTWG